MKWASSGNSVGDQEYGFFHVERSGGFIHSLILLFSVIFTTLGLIFLKPFLNS